MKKTCLCIWVILIIFLGSLYTQSFAAQTNDYEKSGYSKLYQRYLELSEEEKEELDVIPRKYDVPFDMLYENTKIVEKEVQTKKFFGLVRSTRNVQTVVSENSENIPERFDLREHINIKVENQHTDGLCWAFASLNSLETNLSLHTGEDRDLSERHLDYVESEEMYGNRKLHDAGNFDNFVNYADDRLGPVCEEKVPYNSSYNFDEYENLINMENDAYLGETVDFPSIYVNGESDKNEKYTDEELNLFREKVKNHIMENGSFYAVIYAPCLDDYNDITHALYYNGNELPNHAISIIGWDDNYSKDNFKESSKPKNDGAYIALNSWGDTFGENGVFYISYEDRYVEAYMSGVVSSSINDDIQEKEEIEFPDDNLYDDMKGIVSRSVISCDDDSNTIIAAKENIDKVYYLDLNDKGISDITGLDVFHNLDILNLKDNNIRELYPIKNLDLVTLTLDGNTNVNLEMLPNVSWCLSLIGCNIVDLSPLAECKTDTLILDSNPIENIEGLISNEDVNEYETDASMNIDGLNTISLNNTNVSNINPLKYKRNLYSVYCENCGNLSDYNELKQIGCLIVPNCGIEDISQIVELEGLYELNISNNNLTDFSGIEQCENLCVLNASNNIIDISSISDNLGLEFLNLSNNGITSLEEFPYLESLYGLDLSYNNIENYSGLENYNIAGELHSLTLSNCSIESLNDIVIPTSVSELDISNNNIQDFSSLSSIDYLNISNNNIVEFPDLSNLDNIRHLNISHNSIMKFSNLDNTLENLYYLDISYNDLQKIDELENKNIANLDVAYNQIEQIPNIPSLYTINVEGNKIKDVSVFDDNEHLYGINAKKQMIVDSAEIASNGKFEFDVPQIILKARNEKYSNGTNILVGSAEHSYKDETLYVSNNTDGNVTLEVVGGTYDGTTYTLNYTINDDLEIDSLSVENYKSRYIEGENFDNSNMVVKAYYQNGTVALINNYTLSNNENLDESQTTVTVSYKGVSTDIPIIVYSADRIARLYFPDGELYNSVLKTLINNYDAEYGMVRFGDGEIVVLKDIVDSITEYSLHDIDVRDITGLSGLYNLEHVSLPLENLRDISELANLANLKHIEVYSNNLEEIGDVLELANLEKIYLMRDVETVDDDVEKYMLPSYYKKIIEKFGKDLLYTEVHEYAGEEEVSSERLGNDSIEENDDGELYITLDRTIYEDNKNVTKRTIYVKTSETEEKISALCGVNFTTKKELKSIEVIEAPSRLKYVEGESFDPTGMRINKKYTDDSEEEATDYSILPEILSADDNEVIIKVSEDGKEAEASQEIIVYAEDQVVRLAFPDNELYNSILGTLINNYDGENGIIKSGNGEIVVLKEIVDQITEYSLYDVDVRDITGISGLYNLEHVSLPLEKLKDISELERLANLKNIEIYSNELEEIGDVLENDSVERISLVRDIEIISGDTEKYVLPKYFKNIVGKYGKDSLRIRVNDYLDGEVVKRDLSIDPQNIKEDANGRLYIELPKELFENEANANEREIIIETSDKQNRVYAVCGARYGIGNYVKEIRIVKEPDKLEYTEGEEFDSTGMKIVKVYVDGTEEEITDYTYTPEGKLSIEDTTIRISYVEAGGRELVTTQEITVKAKEVTPDTPDEPDNPNDPDHPDEPDNPDNPDKPDDPNKPDKPDNPDTPDTPDKPNNPDRSETSNNITIINNYYNINNNTITYITGSDGTGTATVVGSNTGELTTVKTDTTESGTNGTIITPRTGDNALGFIASVMMLVVMLNVSITIYMKAEKEDKLK